MKIFAAIVISLIFVFGQSISGQNKQPPKTLTLAQQQEDFKIFRGSLDEIHVGLNWFIREILSTNGESVAKIIEKQMPFMSANGRNKTFKYENLARYYQFHYLYSLMNPNVDRFNIEAIPFGAKKKQAFEVQGELPATISDEIRTNKYCFFN